MPASRTAVSGTAQNTAQTDDEILGLETASPNSRPPRGPSRGRERNSGNTVRENDARLQRSERDQTREGNAYSRKEDVGGLRDADRAAAADTSTETAAENAAESATVAAPDSTPATNTDPENFQEIFEANPELREAWTSAQAYREIFPDIEQARAVHKIFPTPADAARAAAELAELDRVDAMFLSNRPESLAELAATVYRMNPQSFENLARVMAGMVGSITDRGSRAEAERNGNSESARVRPTEPAVSQAGARTETSAASNQVDETNAARPTEHGAPNAQATFLASANAAAVERVVDAIESQVDRLLPDGLSAAARNRVVGEIYRELDANLRGNRGVTRQLREAFRSGSLDSDHQRAIVGLLVGRARQALPSVAKKVIEEWTSSVLAASNQRMTRQRAGERRVDIANAGPASSEVRRPLTPGDINYAKLSDADILNL